MGYGRKARRAMKRKMAGNITNEEAEVMLQAGERQLQATICKAENMLELAKPKMEKDIREHYEKENLKLCKAILDEAEAHYKKQAEEYEDKCRREYDARARRTKLEFKDEVLGDMLAMSLWVLHDKFGYQKEELHKFLHEVFLLEASMAEPRLELTINDIVNHMGEGGYSMGDDIDLIKELVGAEMERYDDGYGKPYVPAGSIANKWTEHEDARMRRLIASGVNYLTVGIILNRSEGACKARARKLWGTNEPKKIQEMFKEVETH